MVISDDQVQTNFTGMTASLEIADAAVHRDHQGVTVMAGLVKDVALHSVAVLKAMRDMIADVPAQHLEGPFQNHGRGDSIDIVVAVDQDLFTIFDGGTQAVNHRPHVLHEKGIVQIGDGRVEKSPRSFRIGDVAVHEEGRNHRRDPQFAAEDTNLFRLGLETLPQVLHEGILAAQPDGNPGRSVRQIRRACR